MELLRELMQIEPTKRSRSVNWNGDRLDRRFSAAKKNDGLGSGSSGNVHRLNGPVPRAAKVGLALDPIEEDGYVQFINRILHSDNPYFPKIDELNVYNEDDEPFYTVKMELLHPLSQLSIKEIDHLYRRIFGKDRAATEDGNLSFIRSKFVTYIERIVEGRIPSTVIVDNQMRKAVQILHRMVQQGFVSDLNSDNIMFRRTPYGPQLVFTDPFTGKDGGGL